MTGTQSSTMPSGEFPVVRNALTTFTDSLVAVGAALVAVRDWSFLFGPGLAVANALLLGTLMYRSRLVPRAIPLMGLVGPLLLASNTATMFGVNEQVSLLSLVALPGIFFWELSLGIYLVVKGFRPSPLTDGPDVGGSAPADLRTLAR
ncbi:DUF4386 domain-containing protein [Georgenia sp. SUBG003]|uniref:DUF4386 domain-containing protein n=1 Tax=Georgenia sp. SUBG003 TaxID=1497974 RepID=UPI003AB64DAB